MLSKLCLLLTLKNPRRVPPGFILIARKQEGQVAGPVLRSIFLPPVHLPALVTS